MAFSNYADAPSPRRNGTDRKALIFIMTTAFLNTVGIGLIGPIAPFLVTRYVGDAATAGVTLGWLTSVYALCQLLAAPGLGVLSDRFGRRPILLFCLCGSAIGYLIFGIGGALWILFLGRIIDGITGGNSSVSFAYIADIAPPDERGTYFGRVGAISGIGFILGPVLGGLLARLGYAAPLYVAAAMTFANLLYGLLWMPESLPASQRTASVHVQGLNPVSVLGAAVAIPPICWLLIAVFIVYLPFAALTANLGLFAKDSLQWDAATVGLLFATVGITDIVVQGVLLPRLLKRWNDARVALGGLGCELAGYALIATVPFLASPVPLLVGVMIFAMGDGLLGPSITGLLTRGAGERAQGQVQGGNQAVQSLAIVLGPLLGGALYDRLGHAMPAIIGAALMILAVGAIRLALPYLSPEPVEGGAVQKNV